MIYRVIIERSAVEDLEAITLWIAQFSEDAARKWYRRVRLDIDNFLDFLR
jgi:plasmid stabilization system protein ParE